VRTFCKGKGGTTMATNAGTHRFCPISFGFSAGFYKKPEAGSALRTFAFHIAPHTGTAQFR
jgi:hypothetical protein